MPPIPALATSVFAPSGGFHRLEGLSRDQFTATYAGEQEQHISGEVGEVFVSGFVLAPAPGNLPAQQRQFLHGRLTPLIAHGKAVTAGFQQGHFRLELVNLPPRASLSSIKRAAVQEERAS